MFQRSSYPGFWQSVLLCVTFVFAQGCFITPFSVADALLHLKLISHPAVLGLVNVASCGVVILLARLIGKRPVAAMLSLGGLSPLELVAVVLSSAGAIILNSELDNLLRVIMPLPDWAVQLFGNLYNKEGHLWACAFLLVIVAPVTEELIFRGVILRGLLHRFGVPSSILISSLLFAVVHLNPWQFCTAFGLGLLLGWWYSRSGSLIPCMLGHAAANSALFWAGYVPFEVQGFNPTSAGASVFQPFWFDLSGLGILVLGIWLFRRATAVESGVTPYWAFETRPLAGSTGEAPPVISVDTDSSRVPPVANAACFHVDPGA